MIIYADQQGGLNFICDSVDCSFVLNVNREERLSVIVYTSKIFR
jgi:hypothetical protein